MRLAEELRFLIGHAHSVSRLGGAGINDVGAKDPGMTGTESVGALAGDAYYGLLFQLPIFAGQAWRGVWQTGVLTQNFRYAMCNEAFEGRPFREVCQVLRRFGYEGIEIAPFTLAADPLDITPPQRREFREIMAEEGLGFVGLHWLLVTPKTIHVTTPDKALRDASWQYVSNLIDLCADLGGNGPDNGVMVFGSPKQRSSTGGLSTAEATRNFVDGLAGIAPHAAERGVTILMEALPHSQSDVVHTLEEAVAVVREIDSPGVRTMFDSHNSEDETEPHDELIAKYFELIRHVHVNEMDGRHPGGAMGKSGGYDFVRIFRALKRLGYRGWISLEAFDFEIGGERIASETIEYLKKQEELAGL
jgi:sugar phosphate isomerase/epimerase